MLRRDQLFRVLGDHGCTEVLVKFLAPNDNSKNQPYIAKDLTGFNLLPAGEFRAVGRNFHADLDFSWINDEGAAHPAPRTKLISYSRYSPPEVRLSGFLLGCKQGPNELMTTRMPGRVLFMGVSGTKVFGYVAGPETDLSNYAEELRHSGQIEQRGALYAVPIDRPFGSIRSRIITDLLSVNEMGWIEGQRLSGSTTVPYQGQNAGGYTLESVLGVSANSESAPDLHGWEIKAVNSTKLDQFPKGKAVTLITPAPTGGYYKEKGGSNFIQRFGYVPNNGDLDRLNFSGIHKVGHHVKKTDSTLMLEGHGPGKSPDVDGSIKLIMGQELVGAEWSFVGLLEKWNRKHAQTVYVPYQRSADKSKYRYGGAVLLCKGSDFGLFLDCLHDGVVYYDPGLNVKGLASGVPKAKERHQFRIKFQDIPSLYKESDVELLRESDPLAQFEAS